MSKETNVEYLAKKSPLSLDRFMHVALGAHKAMRLLSIIVLSTQYCMLLFNLSEWSFIAAAVICAFFHWVSGKTLANAMRAQTIQGMSKANVTEAQAPNRSNYTCINPKNTIQIV